MKSILFLFLLIFFINAYSQTTYTFKGNGYWSTVSNWRSNVQPPANLPSGSTINITPLVAGDTCILNTPQTISAGATLNISPNAVFIIEGDMTITTSIPSIITRSVSRITAYSATCGGTITANGGSPVTSSGIVWDIAPSPTTSLVTKTTNDTTSVSYSGDMPNLLPGVTYYVRAYATNSVGTTYGNEVSFTTLSNTDYPSVLISSQIWMSENLDIITYRNGDTIPNITDPTEWANSTTGAWCYYDNDSVNRIYGKLYNWAAVNDPRGLAPLGWHIPSKTEWDTLYNFVYLPNSAFSASLKSVSPLWRVYFFPPTNTTGFSALPAGYRTVGGEFFGLHEFCNFWSATNYSTTDASYSTMNYELPELMIGQDNKQTGSSVRCVKD